MTRFSEAMQQILLYLSTLFLSLAGGTVTGPTTFQADVTLNGNTITQNANVLGTLNVNGAATLSNGETVAGNANFLGTVNANGAVTWKSTETVSGNANFLGTVNANGATTLNSAVTINGNTTLGPLVQWSVGSKHTSPTDGTLQVVNSGLTLGGILLGNADVNGSRIDTRASSGKVYISVGNASFGSGNGTLVANDVNSGFTIEGNSSDNTNGGITLGSNANGVFIRHHPTDPNHVYVATNAATGPGFANFGLYTVAKTTGYTVLYTDTGTHFTNAGASGSVTFTLPTAQQGLTFHFTCTAAQTLNVTGAANTLNAPGNTGKTTASINGATAQYASFTVTCFDGTNWVIRGAGGTITYS